ncbi:MAG: heavy-metal-associated domain-containing protein [Anaerolineae bacterium]
MDTITLHTLDVSCNHCAMTIKRVLGNLEGISAIEVNVPAKTVTFAYADEDVLRRAKAALDEAGYPAQEA